MVKDTFSYSARWDSVGIDCSTCQNFKGPATWPDKQRISACMLHLRSLAIELGSNGYKDGEWFCKQYDDNGKTPIKSMADFNAIKPDLQDGILYCASHGRSDYLKEVSLTKLDEVSPQ